MALAPDYASAIEAFKAKNWTNGTANGLTAAQNQAAVINQPGNTAKDNPANQSYIQGILSQAAKDNQAQQPQTQVTQPVTQPTSNAVVQQAAPQQNNNSLIDQIYSSMYNSQSQKLKALRDQQLAGLAGEDTAANNNAKANLNANDVSGARNSNALKEQLANLGLLKGGDYISQQTAQNTAQGQNANNINMDLATKLQQLAAQKDAINNNASADDLALLQSIQAQQGQAQLNDQYKQQDYGLNLSQLSGQLPGGGQTLAGAAQAYNQSPNNPQNIGQNLTNQLNQLKLNDYPAQSQAAAQQIQQQLTAGSIDNATAQFKLDQLKDPNSPTNQAAQLDLQMKQIDASTYSQTNKLKLEQLQKQIAQIGAAPYQSENDKAMDQVKLQIAQEQLKELQNPSDSKDLSAEMDGLYTGITTGQITPGAAIDEINGKVKAGLLNQSDADKLMKIVTAVNQSQPNPSTVPTLSQDQIDANGGANPQDLNPDQLYKLWQSDPTGKAAGTPSMDWGSWYKDPRGRVGGVSFNTWRQLYGPQLTAG